MCTAHPREFTSNPDAPAWRALEPGPLGGEVTRDETRSRGAAHGGVSALARRDAGEPVRRGWAAAAGEAGRFSPARPSWDRGPTSDPLRNQCPSKPRGPWRCVALLRQPTNTTAYNLKTKKTLQQAPPSVYQAAVVFVIVSGICPFALFLCILQRLQRKPAFCYCKEVNIVYLLLDELKSRGTFISARHLERDCF